MDEGFVGGGQFTFKNNIDTAGINFLSTFKWTYNNCLGFFKDYCDNTTKPGCPAAGVVFNRSTHCPANAKCVNDATKNVADVRQKGIFTNFIPRSGASNINTALKNGPVVSVMELASDIVSHPKDKIYVPRSTVILGHFAVKIVGYSLTEGTYWLVQLPFDASVGDSGIVRVRAGQNIGGLEENAFSVIIEKNIFLNNA